MEEKARSDEVEAGAEALRDVVATFETRIIRIDPRELMLLEVNAHYMKPEMYKRLVANVRRDGRLTSVPFAIWNVEHEKYEVFSGNHRTRAAIDAGLREIDLMVTDDDVPAAQKRAIQLSHNAIFGEDDYAVLKRLYEEIEGVDWKEYSGLDDKTLDMLKKVSPSSLGEANLQFQVLNLVFLPDEIEAAKKMLKEALDQCAGDEKWLVRMREYSDFLELQEIAGAMNGVKNQAVSMMLVLGVAMANVTAFSQALEDREEHLKRSSHWVPLHGVLGTDRVPPEVALKLKRCVDTMVAQKVIPEDKRFQAIDVLLDDFSAGQEKPEEILE